MHNCIIYSPGSSRGDLRKPWMQNFSSFIDIYDTHSIQVLNQRVFCKLRLCRSGDILYIDKNADVDIGASLQRHEVSWNNATTRQILCKQRLSHRMTSHFQSQQSCLCGKSSWTTTSPMANEDHYTGDFYQWTNIIVVGEGAQILLRNIVIEM